MKTKKQKEGRRAAPRDRELVEDHHSQARGRPPQSSSSPTSTAKLVEDLHISQDYASPSNRNPRGFSVAVKQQCWEKGDEVKGRDPDRWRRDALGNIVFRKFGGCPGCLCHDYDHILPYSKGGKNTLENCQVLQSTVNKVKGNQTDIPRLDLVRKSSYCRVEDRDMDLLERSVYGNVRRAPNSGGCRIQ